MNISERQRKSCVLDVKDFCKKSGISLSAFCKEIGVNGSYFEGVHPISQEIANDCYEFISKYEAEINKNDTNFAQLVLEKLELLDLKLDNKKESLPSDLDSYINTMCDWLSVSREEFIRDAVASHAKFHGFLKAQHGDEYMYKTDSNLLSKDQILERWEEQHSRRNRRTHTYSEGISVTYANRY